MPKRWHNTTFNCVLISVFTGRRSNKLYTLKYVTDNFQMFLNDSKF